VARLGVNVDHVATLRQARGGKEPDPVAAAVLAELGGADGIVIHLREDRRHIQDRDLRLLREVVQTKLDLEMAATEEMVRIAMDIKPHLVTFVPERRQELTTEGGLDVAGNRERIKDLITLLHQCGIAVSVFIDPELEQIKSARRVEADCIELHTGRYANATGLKEQDSEFEALVQAGRAAYKLELVVNAGHGLDYRNVRRLRTIPEIVEYNIGHSIIAHAVSVGLERAVREMKDLLR
jgi:pyridoxine 5-phosphate synthase